MITLGNFQLRSGSKEQAEAVFTLVFLHTEQSSRLQEMFAAQRAWIVQTLEREEEAAELALAIALSNE